MKKFIITEEERRSIRVHLGQTSVTQAPEGSTYPVGTVIPERIQNIKQFPI